MGYSFGVEIKLYVIIIITVKEYFDISTQQAKRITKEDQEQFKKMGNWKSPWPYQVQIYCLKHLTSLHQRIAHKLQNILDDANCMPPWFTTGRTALIQNDQTQGKKPSNHRPIACLPTTWKLLSGIVADQITQHLNQHDILVYEQKGSRSGCRGTREQLLIDKVQTPKEERLI